MVVSFNEIWDFLEVLQGNNEQMHYTLVAGQTTVAFSKAEDIKSIRSCQHYDPEWLPFIFTHRNILWQPNVIERRKMLLSPLRIFKSDCDAIAASLKEQQKDYSAQLYYELFNSLSKLIKASIKNAADKNRSISSILSELRSKSFPILSFFIYHPCNKKEYFDDALKRLNYAVKITLTDYHGKYSELNEPHWKISMGKKAVSS